MRVIGYARAAIDAPLGAIATIDEQHAAIERWAHAHRHDLIEVTSDVGRTAGPRLGRRAGLADAFGAVREGRADAIVVASLPVISAEIVELELGRAELTRRGGVLCSTKKAETAALGEHADTERALIRATIERASTFEGVLRDLHVLYRVRSHAAGTEREEAVMARIEELAEQGASASEITSSIRPQISGRVRAALSRARKGTAEHA